MDHGALKEFATAARKKLMQQVAARLDYVLNTDSSELRERSNQIKELKQQIADSSREAVIEKVAYTWFNRFAALRFMDANGYNKIKVVSPQTDFTQPEILAEACRGNIDEELRVDKKFINRLLDGQVRSGNPQNEVFKLLLVSVCNSYNAIMPFMFEKIADYTELLLPDDVLSEHSVVIDFVRNIPDEDCKQVELIGWLYQYYISDKKDQVMGRNAAVSQDDIPAVTQLFTPHWIVRYLVENSLGRLWLLNRPSSKLREKMPYYIDGEVEKDFLKISSPTEIKLLDPASGSGHMLTYGYDVLYAIYEEEGYDSNQIPGLILQHNLYGVEICDRAAALAAFALFMKARGSYNRFFRRPIQPNVICLQEIRFEESELQEYIRALNLGELFNQPMLKLLHQFEEAKNFGSLIQPCLDEKGVAFARGVIESKDIGGQLFLRETHAKVLRVLEQAEYLCNRYQVAVANPPYMGGGAFNSSLKVFASEKYPASKADLFAMFIERVSSLVIPSGHFGMITMHSWMFITSFEKLRASLLRQSTLVNMAHLGPRAFDSISGEVVQTTAFVVQRVVSPEFRAIYLRLVAGRSEAEKEALFQSGQHRFRSSIQRLESIPRIPLAYWISDGLVAAFTAGNALGDVLEIKSGMSTTDNNRFLKLWPEVSLSAIGFGFQSPLDADKSNKKWFPINKGGTCRRWYGNNEYIINWQNDGRDIKEAVVSNPSDPGSTHWSRRIYNTEFFFKPSLTWSKVATGDFSLRFAAEGFLFSDASNGIFCKQRPLKPFLCFLNSKIAKSYLELLAPTLNFYPNDVARIPAADIIINGENEGLTNLATELIEIARADWDNFETSWDFRDLPLLRSGLKGATLEGSWQNWKAHCDTAIHRMQDLETENNRLFIAAYGLQDELKPEVCEDQITLARANAKKDIVAYVSYAVGCMFGRYSLDKPGLILASASETLEDYLKRVPEPAFMADDDGIIPVLEAEYFADDIVGRFREFLKVTFGPENYDKNLEFVEESLGKDIRKYFLTDFYKNHLSNERAYGYKKRPIYWMFSSPKKTFNALIYMHRYHPDMPSLILNNYLREFIVKLKTHKQSLVSITLSESARATDKAKAQREIVKIEKGLLDLEEYEREILFPLAAKRIAIDLDDGVKLNYQKFGRALQPIPGLGDKEE